MQGIFGIVAACDMRLIFHGAIILLLSQLAGYAFLFAINAQKHEAPKQDGPRVGMWRMSHAACSAGAVFLIALGPVVPHLPFGPFPAALLVNALVVSTYGLCLGTVTAGISGHRGTRPRLPWPNLLTNVLYLVGVLGSTVAGVMLMYGATRAYLGP